MQIHDLDTLLEQLGRALTEDFEKSVAYAKKIIGLTPKTKFGWTDKTKVMGIALSLIQNKDEGLTDAERTQAIDLVANHFKVGVDALRTALNDAEVAAATAAKEGETPEFNTPEELTRAVMLTRHALSKGLHPNAYRGPKKVGQVGSKKSVAPGTTQIRRDTPVSDLLPSNPVLRNKITHAMNDPREAQVKDMADMLSHFVGGFVARSDEPSIFRLSLEDLKDIGGILHQAGFKTNSDFPTLQRGFADLYALLGGRGSVKPPKFKEEFEAAEKAYRALGIDFATMTAPKKSVPGTSSGKYLGLADSVDDLELSVRSKRALDTLGIKTIKQLTDWKASEITAHSRNVGPTTIKELQKKLADHGYELKAEYVLD